MAPDEKAATVLSQVAQFHVCTESQLTGPRLHKPAETDNPASAGPVTVAGSEVSSPLVSPAERPATVKTHPKLEVELEAKTRYKAEPCNTFTYFPLLPAELRLKIWHMSFLPRTVVLHTKRCHYADYVEYEAPRWQSQSCNPAALSVNTEARAAALEHYTVAMPLFAPSSRKSMPKRPGDLLQNSEKVLYLNLEQDTVVLLGDLQYVHIMRLLDDFRRLDRPRAWNLNTACGKGLRRLGMSVAFWIHDAGAAALEMFARKAFTNIEEFILFTYDKPLPPSDWRGLCVLSEIDINGDFYRDFRMGRGRQFRDKDGWMVVGKGPMKLADICFQEGW
ncbi:hypothetical protein VTH06DRAFT_2824 [Thermothelomyces fergusii]